MIYDLRFTIYERGVSAAAPVFCELTAPGRMGLMRLIGPVEARKS